LRIAGVCGASLLGLAPPAAAQPDPLLQGFRDPPNSARPRVWWHWMNGNISRDGVQKDLEWMARAGVGGLQNFDVALATPLIVPKRLVYMSPEWKDVFRFAVGEADQLGLEFGIAGSPGWSESGGPWVPPQDAMKKLVWSETLLEGGRPFEGQLPHPPSVAGPYQDLPVSSAVAALLGGAPTAAPAPFYRDAAVIAFPAEMEEDAPAPRVRTGDGEVINGAALKDAAGQGATVPRGTAEHPGVVLIDYDRVQTIRSATVYFAGAGNLLGASLAPVLEAQDSSGQWRKVAEIEAGPIPTTVSFAPVSAAHFRLVLRSGPPTVDLSALDVGAKGAAVPSLAAGAGKTARLALLKLSSRPRIDRSETKAGFSLTNDYYKLERAPKAEVAGVAVDSVLDLTDKLRPDGHLDWTPPPGRWTVLRMGYSLVGATNHPATKEATGLEVDEYDAAAVRRYLNSYLDSYAQTVGPGLMGKRGIRVQVNDSTQVGPSNWTPSLLAQFQRLRGYDPRPWLPALTGVVVGSRAQSDAFLYDFRRTLADLVASEHYGTIAAVLKERGMVGYGEALEAARAVLGDDMAMRRYADVPMAAFWAYNPAKAANPVYLADMKGAASVAHVYGQNLAAAESMTAMMAPWAFAPSDLKRYIDLELVTGINRPVIHTSVHQPVDDKQPGLSLTMFGQYFNRHETWAEMARPWVDYMARSAFLLQQGRNVADVAYFYGEEAPLVALYKTAPPADAPARYGYDFVNADVVLDELHVEAGELVTRGGARYRALQLGGASQRMTLPVLRRLGALATAGATIVGAPPQSSPSLKDDPAEFSNLVHRLWGGGAVTRVGSGRVIRGHDIEAALRSIGLVPDMSYSSPDRGGEILFLHRRTPDGEIYFLNNRKDRAQHVEARFRVKGRAPEIWRADTGESTPVSYRIEGEETVVPLDLGSEDALFVVFRRAARAPSRIVRKARWTRVAEITGDWRVSFQPGRGAPAQVQLDKLQSLTENPDPGVKYFSGTMTYTTSFTLPGRRRVRAPLMLDLGAVGDIAQVAVNGEPVGYAWKAPYRVDIGKAVRRGRNTLTVTVADLWVNRLIGDAQPGARKITYTTLPTYRADAPLRPSGLIGPVTLLGPAGR